MKTGPGFLGCQGWMKKLCIFIIVVVSIHIYCGTSTFTVGRNRYHQIRQTLMSIEDYSQMLRVSFQRKWISPFEGISNITDVFERLSIGFMSRLDVEQDND